MYRYKNLSVALNLTDMDKAVIQYAAMISQMAKPEKVYYLHVTRNLNIPKKILEEYPQLLRPVDEFAVRKMKKTVKNCFDGHPQTKTVYDVVEGSPLEELLRQTTCKDIDLVLIGRKTDATETRRLPMKLARKAPCSVLVIPEGIKPSISNILVPIDFSEHSANAMDVAVAFATAKGISTIQCLHVYQLPVGYYKIGKSEEEFAAIMKKNARESYQKFISGIDLKSISVIPEFVLHKKPAKAIREVVEKEHIDMIVIGARGRSAAAGVLLGSVTEDLIFSTFVPLIAVKKKGTGMKFLQALINI